QALWQHTGAVFFLSLGIWALIVLPGSAARAALIGFAAGAAASSRPAAALLGAALIGALLIADRRHALLAFASAAAPVALHLLANAALFGGPFSTGYGAEAWRGWLAPWPDGIEGTLGVLVSPSRGVLLMSPVLASAAA